MKVQTLLIRSSFQNPPSERPLYRFHYSKTRYPTTIRKANHQNQASEIVITRKTQRMKSLDSWNVHHMALDKYLPQHCGILPNSGRTTAIYAKPSRYSYGVVGTQIALWNVSHSEQNVSSVMSSIEPDDMLPYYHDDTKHQTPNTKRHRNRK